MYENCIFLILLSANCNELWLVYNYVKYISISMPILETWLLNIKFWIKSQRDGDQGWVANTMWFYGCFICNVVIKFKIHNGLSFPRTHLCNKERHIERWHKWYQKVSTLASIDYCSNYHQTSNKGRTLVRNKLADYSDVGASPVGAAPTTSAFPT